jgi:hypothetical protein
VKCESADGYTRDGCVYKEDIDIFDTMNAIVRYSSGVTMSYSVNTCMPIEGYRVAFNGTLGRLEVRDFERQAWDPGEETEMYLIKNFGQREKIEPKGSSEGGHGGGDTRLRDLIFRHAEYTGSRRAQDILANWDDWLRLFVKVIPNDYKRVLDAERRVMQTGVSADQAVMSAFELNSHDQARAGGK